ncbi:CPBP family intramembrane glutamic endopeptidase [Winogradskyella flava]|uniref:CPBP family intramembrane glutamic endopeptidase n=1 Tax=Winogradskyella flava TaxID=1884876 RepID=UPI0024910C3E|nr:CPBP family intramembrane glutamic endopeptidase [Winogradskyella flava]
MIKNKKIKLAIFLLLTGMLGVFSLLSLDITNSIPEDMMYAVQDVPEIALKLAVLLSPTILLILGVLAGIFTYDKTQLRLSIIESILFKKQSKTRISEHLIYGTTLGIITAGVVILISFIFEPFLEDFLNKTKDYDIPLQVRLFYGGITEEVMIRFGVMSLIIFLLTKISKKSNFTIYATGIFLSAFLFALAHFPSLYAMEPNPSVALLFFVTLGNMIAGVVFGWLYWKKSLTAAIIAHMLFHITVVSLEPFI